MTRTTTDPWRNIAVLAMAQALGAASPPIIVSLGGLVGQSLSSDPALVTLPVSLFNLGLALGTLPAAFIMRRLGRRSGYLIGTMFGLSAGLIAASGIAAASFVLFCLGTFTAGFYAAYVQSYRFAAADTVSGAMKARAISWVMVGGLVAVISTFRLIPSLPQPSQAETSAHWYSAYTDIAKAARLPSAARSAAGSALLRSMARMRRFSPR